MHQTCKRIVLAASLCTMGLGAPAMAASAEQPVKRLCEIAVPYERPAGAPKPSDVCFSSRWKRVANDKNPHDSFRAAAAFHATRFVWVYTHDKEFVEKAKKAGYSFWCAINSMVPDAPGGGRQKGRITDLDGKLVTAPWMRAWKDPAWGCVNSPQWRHSYLVWAKRCLDAGSDGLQMDDPRNNYGTVNWGGCFCEYCMTGFRAFLERTKTPEQREKMGISDVGTFDYRTYLKKINAPVGDAFGKWKGGALKASFKDFQIESVRAFYADMRREIDKHAGRHVPFSSNNYDGRWEFPYELFEYGMAEVPARSAKPDRLYGCFREARRRGKAQVFTFVSGDTTLTRQVIATAYACGGHLIVPWDVYMGSSAARYFGKPDQYADLYKFVRDHAGLFDRYEDAAFAIPGKKDERYARLPPVQLPADTTVSAFVRAVPGKDDAPVVIHLVDWGKAETPFEVVLHNRRFSRSGSLSATLLRPGQDEAKLEKSSEGERTTLRVPALRPWGIVVVAPDTSAQ